MVSRCPMTAEADTGAVIVRRLPYRRMSEDALIGRIG
jgi:hypothetical protein